jgi:hypothetical protein
LERCVCGRARVTLTRVAAHYRYMTKPDNVPGSALCPAEHHCGHNKHEAIELHTIAIIIRVSSRIDNKVIQSIYTIYTFVEGRRCGLV